MCWTQTSLLWNVKRRQTSQVSYSFLTRLAIFGIRQVLITELCADVSVGYFLLIKKKKRHVVLDLLFLWYEMADVFCQVNGVLGSWEFLYCLIDQHDLATCEISL